MTVGKNRVLLGRPGQLTKRLEMADRLSPLSHSVERKAQKLPTLRELGCLLDQRDQEFPGFVETLSAKGPAGITETTGEALGTYLADEPGQSDLRLNLTVGFGRHWSPLPGGMLAAAPHRSRRRATQVFGIGQPSVGSGRDGAPRGPSR